MLTQTNKLWIAVFGVLLAFTFTSQASDTPTDDPDPTVDDLMGLVDRALPVELITEDNTKLVAQLLNPKLGTPLSRSFNPAGVVKALFGRGGATLSPDCRKLATAVGDMDQGDCVASNGTESGAGAYRMLRFSKHMALGNIVYTNRAADQVVDPAKLVPVKMTDLQAYENAVTFLKGLGLPAEEFPVIPQDAKLPVRTIALGWVSDDGNHGTVPVEKMVMIPRGLLVNAHQQLPQVAGPGKALVVMDDREVKEAVIQGWQEVMPYPNAERFTVKTRTELIKEIAEDIAMDHQGPVDAMNFQVKLIVVGAENGVGLLLPAVQAIVMPVARDLSEEEQVALSKKQSTTAGMIREYSLVNLDEKLIQPGGDETPLQ